MFGSKKNFQASYATARGTALKITSAALKITSDQCLRIAEYLNC